MGGQQQQDHLQGEGQLITFHLTRLEAPRPSWVALTGEEEPGGMEALRTFVEEERWSLREGRTLEVLFKNSERMFRESESEMSADHLFVFE